MPENLGRHTLDKEAKIGILNAIPERDGDGQPNSFRVDGVEMASAIREPLGIRLVQVGRHENLAVERDVKMSFIEPKSQVEGVVNGDCGAGQRNLVLLLDLLFGMLVAPARPGQ